ncbi:uncharacterized protein JCM6883_004818, partial [Sporobolomyces salmoneus]|uniref:uncharacterized protein n=1 Tax=Sporobolomyces salmoneus TaxID=183962 RepID=UPI0031823CD0
LPAALALTVPGGSSLPPSNEALPLEQRSTTPPASISPDPSSSSSSMSSMSMAAAPDAQVEPNQPGWRPRPRPPFYPPYYPPWCRYRPWTCPRPGPRPFSSSSANDAPSSIGTNEQEQPSSSSMNSRLSKRDPFFGGFGDFGDFDIGFWKRQALNDLDSADSLDAESSSSTLAKRQFWGDFDLWDIGFWKRHLEEQEQEQAQQGLAADVESNSNSNSNSKEKNTLSKRQTGWGFGPGLGWGWGGLWW